MAATGDYLGFSKELGGLLAGVSLASTQFREAMAARLAPLRDFLLLFFFIALDARLDLSLLGQQIPSALTFSLSTYMITYSHHLYAWLEPFLGPFERRHTPREVVGQTDPAQKRYDIVLFGLGRYGSAITHRLIQQDCSLLGVDFNPSVVREWQREGVDVAYGDATDPELVASLPLDGVKWVVSGIPEHQTGVTHEDARLGLIDALRSAGYIGRVAITAHRGSDAERFAACGADLILQPFRDAADQAAQLLVSEEGKDLSSRTHDEAELG